MLIMSQSKRVLINFDRVSSLIVSKTDEEKYCILLRNELNGIIGRYESEQRAIGVLDEICSAYIGLNCVDRKTGIAVVKNGIFQMPDE